MNGIRMMIAAMVAMLLNGVPTGGSEPAALAMPVSNDILVPTTSHYRDIEPEVEPEFVLTDDEVDLIAWITVGEAEGESEYGQRLVIDTILNRVESEHFPDSVYDVIYQKNQFSCTTDGRLTRCSATDDTKNLVWEEAESRTNDQVIYFRTGKYSSYGEPLFKEGAHYFSAY